MPHEGSGVACRPSLLRGRWNIQRHATGVVGLVLITRPLLLALLPSRRGTSGPNCLVRSRSDVVTVRLVLRVLRRTACRSSILRSIILEVGTRPIREVTVESDVVVGRRDVACGICQEQFASSGTQNVLRIIVSLGQAWLRLLHSNDLFRRLVSTGLLRLLLLHCVCCEVA